VAVVVDCFRVARLAFWRQILQIWLFQRQLASEKFVWLFNIWLFLEAVGTYHQTGVLAFQISC